jgi:hypothetical protein
MWWHTPTIPAVRRLRQEDYKFKVSQNYIATPCLKKTNKNHHAGVLKIL